MSLIRDLKEKHYNEMDSSGLKPTQYLDGINLILLTEILEELKKLNSKPIVEKKPVTKAKIQPKG